MERLSSDGQKLFAANRSGKGSDTLRGGMSDSRKISRTRLAGLSAEVLERMLETRRVSPFAPIKHKSATQPKDLGSLTRLLRGMGGTEVLDLARNWEGDLPLDLGSMAAVCRASPYTELTLFVAARLFMSSHYDLAAQATKHVITPNSLKQVLSGNGDTLSLVLRKDLKPAFNFELTRAASRLFSTLTSESVVTLVEQLDPVDESLISAVAQLRQVVNHNPRTEQYTSARRLAQRAMKRAHDNGRWTAAWAAQVVYAAASSSSRMLGNVLALEEMAHASYRQTLLLEWTGRAIGGEQPSPRGNRQELEQEQFIRLLAVLLGRSDEGRDNTLA